MMVNTEREKDENGSQKNRVGVAWNNVIVLN